MTQTLDRGRKAIQQHDWDAALRALNEADQESELSPDDLMLLGDAYWWSAQPDDAIRVFERAFSAYLDEDLPAEAAKVGSLLAYFALRRQAVSVFRGWVSRVEKLLDGAPEDEGHAWYQLLKVAQAIFVDNDLDAVIQYADEAMEMAQRQHVPGIHSLALGFKGASMVLKGQWREGMALIDEATVGAMASEGDLRASSDVYCITIGVCSSLADYRRAGEWTDQAERWMRANSVGGFTGICQVHRAELKRLHGSWPEAESEARKACIELERFRMLDGIGFAQYEIGEVRRRMGDFTAAEEAFMRAYQHGHPAQPGMALLQLDRGEIDEAVRSINQAVTHTTAASGSEDLLTRGHLLPAQVEILIAAGDLNGAQAAITELEELADLYESPSWEAMALSCRGSFQLSSGNPDQASETLDRAWRLWQRVELPYETAKVREMLGRALLESGGESRARLEFRAARSIYERLGAAHDLSRLEDVAHGVKPSEAAGARLTKAFMFTDIVTSTDLIGIIGDAAWENLLKWHDRELRATFAKHGGEEVRHTGDGFFVAFESDRAAIECAVAIQRSLDEHRRQHGFSPRVRIGLHHAEATRKGGDYSGQGVHAAARIGDLAAGDEIVASAALLEAAGSIPYPADDPREVELKGITTPVLVRGIDWRS